jgi:hypothetical protein
LVMSGRARKKMGYGPKNLAGGSQYSKEFPPH